MVPHPLHKSPLDLLQSHIQATYINKTQPTSIKQTALAAMCVTNIYTDRYPDGQEGYFKQFNSCLNSSNGQPCPNHEILNNCPRDIQYGEPTSAQMFPQTQVPQTPPRSSSSSQRTSAIYTVLESDDGTASGTGTYSSGGTRKKHQSAKSKALLSLLGVKLESSSDKRKRREREARKDRIVVVDETTYEQSGPSSPRASYTRPVPGPVRSTGLPRNIHFPEPIGVQYTPGPTRQPPTIVTQMPDTPPVIHDAFPSPQPVFTRDVFPQPATVRDAVPPLRRSVSPVRIPERDRRPHVPVQRPLIFQNHQSQNRDPSPPAVFIRTPTPPPQPPAPAAAAPISERSRSQSRARVAPQTPSPNRRRESSRSRDRRRRGRSPEPSYRRGGRRDESTMRRQRFSARDEEIRNRPVVPMAPRDSGTPRDVQLERERRPYVAPVMEQSRRLNDMMGGLNIRDAAPAPAPPVVDSGMLGRLRERHAPLSRRNTISTPQGSGTERRTAGGAERRRERHRVLYDDGTVRYE